MAGNELDPQRARAARDVVRQHPAMVLMAVMIPVNILLFSQGLGRFDRPGQQFPDSKGVATGDAGQDTQVRPQQLGRLEHQG